ncbi:hypothetical protein GQ53DRAFT_753170 [Thozetella sp. PMI_491]|nr:hypothetical protein GQ53DRAFT_753170 [Thozetella sp. PMI_491]
MFIYIPTPDDHDFSSVWSNFGSHEPGNEMGNASQPADTDPFLPSNPIPSACSTTQAQAISPLPHPNASGQFSVNNTPLATYLGHLESQPQPQPPRRSESTEQFSSAATTANVTRSVYRRKLRWPSNKLCFLVLSLSQANI